MHYNLVKASNRRYLEELKNRGHEMKPVYDAVNIMQDTEWVINKPIYEVILSLINTDSSLGHLPTNPQEIELPVKPVDIETNKESLVKWKREESNIYKEQAKSKSKNTPIENRKLQGKVTNTFVKGEELFKLN